MSFGQADVLALESRRANEMAELIRINGGRPFVAPSMTEVPLAENNEAFAFAQRLAAGEFDMMIFLTGVGARILREALASRGDDARFIEDLRRLAVVARGPKPMAVLREWKVPVAVSVPEPNTWREILSSVEARPEKSVAVQEYGRANVELLDGLAQQGRTVSRLPVYQWKLPEDSAPLKQALSGLLAGRFAAVLFTTSTQVDHLLELARQQNQEDAVLKALHKAFLGSIGPACSEALRTHGLNPAMEPSHPKMGLLVREAAQAFCNTSGDSIL
ncbi:MAG TPA: uroporphyrinogen-III synthase [Bryobacteraceae bacterium]|jgi:uroporphyrinogen-III synthase|nr:uroporphyrinogen-III synthase [Bryobacteraceae bacterium]